MDINSLKITPNDSRALLLEEGDHEVVIKSAESRKAKDKLDDEGKIISEGNWQVSVTYEDADGKGIIGYYNLQKGIPVSYIQNLAGHCGFAIGKAMKLPELIEALPGKKVGIKVAKKLNTQAGASGFGQEFNRVVGTFAATAEQEA